jgi:hypothetical protein
MSLVDRFLNAVRNNPVTAVLIIVGIVVSSLASFSDAVRKLVALAPKPEPADVRGRWVSQPLADARTKVTFSYTFEIQSEGGRLYGSAVRTAPACAAGSKAGVCTGFGKPVALLETAREGDTVSFACDWGELPGAGPWTWVPTRESFRAQVAGVTMTLVMHDNQNRPPVQFSAAREPR